MKRFQTTRGAISTGDERGMAMVVCTLILFVLMMAMMSAYDVALLRMRSAKKADEADQATTIAEAGADCVLYELQLGTDSSNDGIGIASGTIGKGSFSASVTPPYAGSQQYTIRSVGTVNGMKRGVERVVSQPPDNNNFFAATSVLVSGSGIIDSYNSSAGTYASQVGPGGHAGLTAQVASNGNITLNGAAKIWGNAIPGPGHTVMGNVASVSGSTAPSSTMYPMPPYVYAPSIAAGPAFSGSKAFSAGTYRYSTFTVRGNNTVTFSGNVALYVDGNFEINGAGTATINPGAKLTIYQSSGTFIASGNGIVNSDQKPKSLSVSTATSSAVTVTGTAAFFGSIYAPNAPFTSSGASGFYGSVKANSITNQAGSMHADQSLGATSGPYQVQMARLFLP
jgi:hypothetical protein